MILWSSQTLTEMSTMNLSGGEGRPGHKADNLTICKPVVYINVEASQHYGRPPPITRIALRFF
jgi:hypothetical protein